MSPPCSTTSSTTFCHRPAAATDACRTSASASATNGSSCTSSPSVQVGRLEANTARTLLLLDHQPLPWSRWGEEFAALMPAEILRLQERAASADGVPRQEAIRSRVSAILPLYRLSRYRPTPPAGESPRQAATNKCVESPADARATGTPPRVRQPAPDTPSTPADAERRYEPSDGEPLTLDADTEQRPQPMVSLPDVAWISARDGSRAPGDLEDQAARYHPGRHELTINADFRAISDLIVHWRRRYQGVPGARTVIEAHVREWCEQILVEVVLAARNTSWSEDQLDALLSPTSFSAALLPRHLLHATLQKRLAQKLGTARAEPSRAPSEPRIAPRDRSTSRHLGHTREQSKESAEDAR